MASYQKMGQELECPICMDFFKVPKIMGKCHHAACLECLKNLVAVTNKNFFPCPVCREKCSIPPKGVTDLKTDFRLATLVEQYQQMKRDKSAIYCSACSNPACHFCEKCDKLYLCRECSRKHSQDPLTAAHELVGICTMHGKILTMYCRKCGIAICSVCLINDHPSDSQEHDVAPHQEVADEQAEAVAAAVKKLDGTQKEKKNALGKIRDIQDSVLETIDSAVTKLAQQLDTSIECADNKQSKLTQESSNIQKQIEVLTKHKNIVDKEIVLTEQKRTSLGRQKEHHTQYLNQYRDGCRDKFQEAVTQAVAENEVIKRQLDKGRKETSTWSEKRILDDKTVPSFIKVKAELTKAFTEAEQVDRVAPFLAAKENMIKYVRHPVSGQTAAQLRFSTMKKIAAESDRYEYIQNVRHFADGCLAVLYRERSFRPFTLSCLWNPADRISLHKPGLEGFRLTDVMDDNVHPAVDMTVSPKGELLVLRAAKPSVRVFNKHTSSDFRDINLNVGEAEIRNFFSIETDEEGNIFVADTTGRVRVFNREGAIINEIMIGKLFLGRLNFCRFTSILHIACDQSILRYYWDGTTLKAISSYAHGIGGFNCMDIGIGVGGEVFVAGIMKPACQVLVFQIVEHESGKAKMIKLAFDDNVDRKIARGWFPQISVFGNTLALGLKDKLELFHLKP